MVTGGAPREGCGDEAGRRGGDRAGRGGDGAGRRDGDGAGRGREGAATVRGGCSSDGAGWQTEERGEETERQRDGGGAAPLSTGRGARLEPLDEQRPASPRMSAEPAHDVPPSPGLPTVLAELGTTGLPDASVELASSPELVSPPVSAERASTPSSPDRSPGVTGSVSGEQFASSSSSSSTPSPPPPPPPYR
nr:verprolin-like [Aegilops tauschii subsp. strangulata]